MNGRLRLGLLLAALAVAGWLAVFGDKTPPGTLVEARVEGAPPRATPAAPPAVVIAPEDDVPPGQVRRLPRRAGWYEDALAGNDLFAPPVREAGAVAPAAPPPPPEPPFRLIGRMAEAGQWTYFLEREHAAHALRVGDEAAGFRLSAASAQELVFTRLADRARFTLALDAQRP